MSIALIIVSWALLLVVLYAGAVLREKDYGAKQMEWEKQRFNLIAVVFSEASVVVAVPEHGTFEIEKQGGNVVYTEGGHPGIPGEKGLMGMPQMGTATRLNYETLAEMAVLMTEMESERRVATNRLKKALKVVGTWETAHPQPEPPTYFGRRFHW